MLHDLLEASARRRPDACAVLDGPRAVTYGELDGDADRIAHVLAGLGIGPGDRVGLFIEKSYESIAGLYGILKAGAAYVPLDPKGPGIRLGYIASNCGLRCIVTGTGIAKRWQELLDAGAPVDHLVVVDDGPLPAEGPPEVTIVRCSDAAAVGGAPALEGHGPDSLAYVLYTSGSTGQPKGVMLSHRNGLAFVEWAADELGIHEDDRVSSHAPLHFDLSIFDVYVSSLAGATLVLVPPKASVFPSELVKFIRTTEITTWYSVPSILSMLVERGGLADGGLPSLRHVVFAGEVFPTPYLTKLMGLVPDARYWNLYGPTETNVCTWYEVPSAPDPDGPDIPIGRAIREVETIVADDDLAPLPAGEVGELLVAGPTVMVGYWGDPDKTSQRLVANPLGGSAWPLAYRTGDLVVEQPDGDLRFVGRRDNQVKSRGYRIELGEVETALRSHPDVLECAVVAEPDPLITNRLVAHVVLRAGGDAGALNAHCLARVPNYMLPASFELHDALPRTSTDKIDRQALRAQPPS